MDRYEFRKFLRRRFRHWRRWFLWSLRTLFVLLAVGGLYLALHHWYAVKRLAQATAEQDANYPGWRLEDIEAARAEIPDEENGAVLVHKVRGLVPEQWPPRDVELPNLSTLPPNRDLDPEMIALLRELLEVCQPARSEARQLAERPTGRSQLSYARNPLETLVPHLQEMRTVECLLEVDALLRIEDGELDEAVVLCLAAFNTGRAIGDEPFSISQLVREVCATIASKLVERLLAHGELNDEELAALQRSVEEEGKYPGLLVAFRGERAVTELALQRFADGEIHVEGNGTPTGFDRLNTFYGRDTLHLQHAQAFPIMNKLVEIGEAPPHLRAPLLQQYRALLKAQPFSLVTVLLPAVEKLEGPFRRRDAQLSCLAAALATERYRRSCGAWPKSLTELAPKFLQTAPLDVFDDQPLRYLPLHDGVVIYSLCPDGYRKVFDPEKPSLPGEGVAVRLWDVRQRKQDK